jgi:hypothetical protein
MAVVDSEPGASIGGSSLIHTKSQVRVYFFTIINATHAINIMYVSAMMHV